MIIKVEFLTIIVNFNSNPLSERTANFKKIFQQIFDFILYIEDIQLNII